jgi:hypothetical protein
MLIKIRTYKYFISSLTLIVKALKLLIKGTEVILLEVLISVYFTLDTILRY